MQRVSETSSEEHSNNHFQAVSPSKPNSPGILTHSRIEFEKEKAETGEEAGSFSSSTYNMGAIARNLISRGIPATPHGKLIGKSGVEHEFSLVVAPAAQKQNYSGNNNDERKKTSKRRLLVLSRGENEDELLSFFARALDTGAKEMVFIMPAPKLDGNTKRFADSYGILIFGDKDSHRGEMFLAEKIVEIMNRIGGALEHGGVTGEESDKKDSAKKKRSSFDIIADILTISESPISKTEILYRANLSFKQAQKYLGMLEKMELIRKYFEDGGASRKYVVTQKGREQLRSLLNQFGRIAEGSTSIWE